MDNTSDLSIRQKIRVQQANNMQEKKDAFAVRTKVFIDEQRVPSDLEYDEHDESSGTIHFVAYHLDQPVGAARLREYTPKVGKAERVAVISEVRGLGIGAELMNKLTTKAKELGFQKIKLNAQLHAEPFYKQLGYAQIGDVFLEADIEHIAMEKELD